MSANKHDHHIWRVLESARDHLFPGWEFQLYAKMDGKEELVRVVVYQGPGGFADVAITGQVGMVQLLEEPEREIANMFNRMARHLEPWDLKDAQHVETWCLDEK